MVLFDAKVITKGYYYFNNFSDITAVYSGGESKQITVHIIAGKGLFFK